MVTQVVETFLDTISALFGGIADGLVDLFGSLIYDGTTLTPIAQWMLIFMGFTFAISIFMAFLKKVS